MSLKIQRFVCNPFQENCFVVSDETNEGVIIDCGAYFAEERKAIVDYVEKEGIRLKHLLGTHGHVDHHFGDDTIYSKYGLRPEVSAKDEYLQSKLNEQSLTFCGQPLGYEMPPVGKYLSDNDVIEFGSHRFTIIPTPGHTPGSVFFYCKEENIAFSGDTLFRKSIGRTDFELGNYDDIIVSLQSLSNHMPLDTSILPGHGPQTTLSDEVQCNPYFK